VPTAPIASRAKVKNTRVSHHRFAETLQHSLRNGFTAYFVLSPVTGLFCHRRLADHPAKLDASVGASGPHDFAVRVDAIRRWHLRVHRISRPTFVTIAKRPSYRVRDGGDLPDGTSKIFFARGLDTNFAKLPVGQISALTTDFVSRVRRQLAVER
jgi:hypothetical protein